MKIDGWAVKKLSQPDMKKASFQIGKKL